LEIPNLVVNPIGTPISGTTARKSRLSASGLQPDSVAGDIALQLVLSPGGKACLWNVIQFVLNALKIVPEVGCGQDIIEPLVAKGLQNAAAAGVSAGLNGGSLDAGDQQSSAVQNNLDAMQIL
jgi:hypothetical protein